MHWVNNICVNGLMAKDEMSLSLRWWIIISSRRWLLDVWIIIGWEEPCALWIAAFSCPTFPLISWLFTASLFFGRQSDDYFIGGQTEITWLETFLSLALLSLRLSTSMCCDLAHSLLIAKPSQWASSLFDCFQFMFKKGDSWNKGQTLNMFYLLLDLLRSRSTKLINFFNVWFMCIYKLKKLQNKYLSKVLGTTTSHQNSLTVLYHRFRKFCLHY